MFHVYMGEALKDWKACADLVRTISHKYRIPFFTVSPTYSICKVHGYLIGQQFECPKCKAEKEKEAKPKKKPASEKKTAAKKKRKSTLLEKPGSAAANTVGREIGKSIVRGILGILKK